MTIDQILQHEIQDPELWLSREKDESKYKRDLKKRIELINWLLENMKTLMYGYVNSWNLD
jgi:hypothetical protein